MPFDLTLILRCGFGTALALAWLATLGVAQAAPTVSVQARSAPSRAAYGIAEWTVVLDQTYANPFDPDEIAVDGVFTGPHGLVLRQPGFWYQAFRRQAAPDHSETLVPAGRPEWRVRFCPAVPGLWKLTVMARDPSGLGQSPALSFTVQPSPARGFIERVPGNSRYLQYDTGQPYFLIGENVGWAGKAGLADYEAWFPRLAAAGGNYARVWMAWQPLEHQANAGGGLGRYDLANAWYFDQVFSLAGQSRLRCMLALGSYSEFTTGGYFHEGQWAANPYNKANGGPAATPDDFWTAPAARALYRRRLRYLIARYGAETSLGLWELWNETDAPAPWVQEMASYLKQNDPYKHLVTNSYATTGKAAVWNLPQIDLTQTHRYGDEGDLKDIAPVILDDARAHDTYAKPHLMGEFGISWRNSDARFDPSGLATNLHNGLWASTFVGNSGGAAVWWWDNYVHPQNLYSQFTGLAKFAATVDWPRRRFAPLAVPPLIHDRAQPETLTDLVLTPTGGWGDKAATPVVIHPDGTLTGGPLLSTLFGPDKAAQRSVQTLQITLARPGTLVVHVATVSNLARLHLGLDGRPLADFSFHAAPGQGGGYESTQQFPEYGGIYQARFNTDRTVALPAGAHVLTLENADGDWFQIARLTFTHAISSRYAFLRTAALQDADTGETLLWLQDPDSNWDSDRAGHLPRLQHGLRLPLPLPRPGLYQITWWDTRRGVPVQKLRLPAPTRRLLLTVPAFTRDIALHAVRLGTIQSKPKKDRARAF